jgi:hypothetical protein
MPFLGSIHQFIDTHVLSGRNNRCSPFRVGGHPVIFQETREGVATIKGRCWRKSIIEVIQGIRLYKYTEGVIKDIDTWKDYKKEIKKGFINYRN